MRMRLTMCGGFLAGSLLALPVAAQPPSTAAPADPSQTPVSQEVKGPRLGSPEIVALGPGVNGPRLTKEVKPRYTATAMKAGVQGMVKMDCVVLPDGTIGDVKVTKSLHPDLDTEAVKTVRQWLMLPATLEGQPVPVKVEIEMSFSLGAPKPR